MVGHIAKLSQYCEETWALRVHSRQNKAHTYVYRHGRSPAEVEEAQIQRALVGALNTGFMPSSSATAKLGGHSQQISSPSLVRAKPHKLPTRQQDSASSQLRQRHKHVWQCRRHIHAHRLLTCATHTSALHASHASVYASQGTRAVPFGIIGQGMWTCCPYQLHAVFMDCRPALGAQECNGGSEIAVPEGTTKCIRLYASGQPHWTHDPSSGCAPLAAQHAHTWSMRAPRTY